MAMCYVNHLHGVVDIDTISRDDQIIALSDKAGILRYISNPDDELVKIAIDTHPLSAILCIRYPSLEIQEYAMIKNISVIFDMPILHISLLHKYKSEIINDILKNMNNKYNGYDVTDLIDHLIDHEFECPELNAIKEVQIAHYESLNFS